jgi:hypothetical protein
MGDNPYEAPPGNDRRGHPVRLLVRLALILNYPFVAISCLAFLGLTCGGAFVTEFAVENQTNHTIYVTPIGTVNQKGAREPLPVCIWTFPTIWSPQRGGFPVPAGESIEIMYDMDDINFSEIVIHDVEGERGQLVVNPDPTRNLYHPPANARFVIDDLDALVPVPLHVRSAARRAQVPTSATWIVLAVLCVPWDVWIALSCLHHSKRLRVLDAFRASGALCLALKPALAPRRHKEDSWKREQRSAAARWKYALQSRAQHL